MLIQCYIGSACLSASLFSDIYKKAIQFSIYECKL
jgi:hypothetical protein